MNYKSTIALLVAVLLTGICPVIAEENEYVIGVGDKIWLKIYREADLSGPKIVNEKGSISMPLIGNVVLGEKTTEEAAVILTEKLSKYIIDPQVSLTVVSFGEVNIFGEVRRPGLYPITVGMDIMDGLSLAGGFTGIAADNSVRVIRKTDEGTETIVVDIKSMTKKGQNTNFIKLRRGDIIFVPESQF